VTLNSHQRVILSSLHGVARAARAGAGTGVMTAGLAGLTITTMTTTQSTGAVGLVILARVTTGPADHLTSGMTGEGAETTMVGTGTTMEKTVTGADMQEGTETDIRMSYIFMYLMYNLYQPGVGCKVNGFLMTESKCFSREI
jgi:hypothetical protein